MLQGCLVKVQASGIQKSVSDLTLGALQSFFLFRTLAFICSFISNQPCGNKYSHWYIVDGTTDRQTKSLSTRTRFVFRVMDVFARMRTCSRLLSNVKGA